MRTLPVVRRSLSLFAGAGILAVAACSQQAALPTAGPSAAGALVGAPAVRSSAARRPKTLPSHLLFLTNEDSTISIYPLANPVQSGPLATISGLKGFQQQMVVDGKGNLFFANNGPSADQDYVAEYAPPYDGPPTILNTVWQSELFYPVGITADSHGTIYVDDCGKYCFESPGIFVYPVGATSPSKVITSPKFDSMSGLAVDAHDNLYVLSWNSTTFSTDVYEIAAGTTTVKALKLHGLSTGDGGNGLTFDATGDLFVGSGNSGSNYITAYRPGAHNAYKIIDSMTFGDEPEMIDIGPDGNLYVPIGCPFGPCVQMYAFHPHAAKAFESIGSPQAPTNAFGVATAPNLQLEGK